MQAPVFFISTGRCGPQFFADKLAQHYSDLAVVEHEPLQQAYAPVYFYKKYYRNELPQLDAALERHIAGIERLCRDKIYIETG